MDEENLNRVLTLLNTWWRDENIEEEDLKARVVLIFKKRRLKQIRKLQTNFPTKHLIQNLRSNPTKKNLQNPR